MSATTIKAVRALLVQAAAPRANTCGLINDRPFNPSRVTLSDVYGVPAETLSLLAEHYTVQALTSPSPAHKDKITTVHLTAR